MNVSPNRVVAIATPLVFAPLAGTVAALAAKYAPGLEIDQGQLVAVFIAGATIAFAKAGLWLKGWQDYEKRQEAIPPSRSSRRTTPSSIPRISSTTTSRVGSTPTSTTRTSTTRLRRPRL